MADSWETIQARGQQSCGVWQAFAPAFTVGQLSLAVHVADVAELSVRAQAVADQEAVVDAARDVRRASLGLIENLSIRLPRMAQGALPPEDTLQNDLETIQHLSMDGSDSIAARGRKVATAWTLVNARLAALTPPVAVLVVGGTQTLAMLEAALTGLPDVEQEVEDTLGDLREVRSELRELATKVDRNNKRWYVAWLGNFPAGTAEGDAAIAQVDTGTPGGGGAGSSSSSSSSSSSGALGPVTELAAEPDVQGGGLTLFTWVLPPGATGARLRSGPEGPEQSLLAEAAGSEALLSLTLGTEMTVTAAAFNATTEGPQSEALVFTVT